MDAWLTPDAEPIGVDLVTVTVPSHPVFVAVLRGLLLDMANPENWETSEGGISPEVAAEWAGELYQSFEVAYGG